MRKRDASWLNQLENVVYTAALAVGIAAPAITLSYSVKPQTKAVVEHVYHVATEPSKVVLDVPVVVTKTAVPVKEAVFEEKPASKPKIKPKSLDDYIPISGVLQSALLKVRFGRVHELQGYQLKNLYNALCANPELSDYKDLFVKSVTEQLTKQTPSQVINALDLVEAAYNLFDGQPEYRDFNDALTECVNSALEHYLAGKEPMIDTFMTDVLKSLTEQEGKDNTITYRTKPLSDNLRMLHTGTWQTLLENCESRHRQTYHDSGKTAIEWNISDYEEKIREEEAHFFEAQQQNKREDCERIAQSIKDIKANLESNRRSVGKDIAEVEQYHAQRIDAIGRLMRE